MQGAFLQLIVGLLVFLALLAAFGLAGESDRVSFQEARYRAALSHCDAAREAGR
jgi:hypothetical protein